jgi:hypothetical protein
LSAKRQSEVLSVRLRVCPNEIALAGQETGWVPPSVSE